MLWFSNAMIWIIHDWIDFFNELMMEFFQFTWKRQLETVNCGWTVEQLTVNFCGCWGYWQLDDELCNLSPSEIGSIWWFFSCETADPRRAFQRLRNCGWPETMGRPLHKTVGKNQKNQPSESSRWSVDIVHSRSIEREIQLSKSALYHQNRVVKSHDQTFNAISTLPI